MTVQLTKDSIDLGIVVRDADAAVRFYRDLLGFKEEGTMPVPGGVTMHRLWCGTSLIKLLRMENAPEAAAPGGGLTDATGYRYFTMQVSNLSELMEECKNAGVKVITGPREIRPGVSIGLVRDPDGNIVEFVQQSQT